MIKPSQIVKFVGDDVRLVTPVYSSPGEFLGGYKKTIFRYANGKTELFLNNPNENYVLFALDTSYNFIAYSYFSGSLFIYNLKNNSLIKKKCNWECINHLCISLDENIIVTACKDQTCRVYSTETGQEYLCYREHTANPNRAAFYTDNQVLSGGVDGLVRHWNTQTGNTLAISSLYGGSISTIRVSRNVAYITFAGDNNIALLDANTLIQVSSLRGHSKIIVDIAFSPNGEYLVSAAHNYEMILWNAQTRVKIAQIIGDNNSKHITSVCFSGNNIAVAANETLRVYNNIPLSIFLINNNLEYQSVKTIQSFFHALMDIFNPLAPFNDDDTDNYFLMRILCQFK